MNMRLYKEMLDSIIPFLQPQLDQFHHVDPIIPRPDKVLIQGTVNEHDVGKTMLINVLINHEHQQVCIPNIFMPPFMAQQGIGKTLIRLIYDAAKASGYEVFVTDLVPSFYRRLVNRGATIIEADDVVQITDKTDLTHKPA